jgi:nucleoside-diphosphate-sugar epimerase
MASLNLQTGTVPVYIDIRGLFPFYSTETQTSMDATFTGSVATTKRMTMRVFVTGATGFIGTELVKELIEAGHQVRGLTRSDAGVEQLKAVGAEVHRGDITDLDSLRSGATGMDAVVNLAFNHGDMSKLAQNAKDEIQAIEALGSVLEPGKLLVVTSGIGLTPGAPGQARKETDPPAESRAMPRRPEQAAQAVAAKGVAVAIVRLPQVHDTRKQGLITMLIQIARQKGVSAYVEDGANRWAAAPLKDVANLYRLAVDKTGAGMTTYHAVQEQGVSLLDIAETIGKGLTVPVVSIPVDKAGEHFGVFFGHAATMDMPGSSEWTRKTLGWEPTGPGLIEDLANMKY